MAWTWFSTKEDRFQSIAIFSNFEPFQNRPYDHESTHLYYVLMYDSKGSLLNLIEINPIDVSEWEFGTPLTLVQIVAKAEEILSRGLEETTFSYLTESDDKEIPSIMSVTYTVFTNMTRELNLPAYNGLVEECSLIDIKVITNIQIDNLLLKSNDYYDNMGYRRTVMIGKNDVYIQDNNQKSLGVRLQKLEEFKISDISSS